TFPDRNPSQAQRLIPRRNGGHDGPHPRVAHPGSVGGHRRGPQGRSHTLGDLAPRRHIVRQAPGLTRSTRAGSVVEDAALEHPALLDVLSLDRDEVALRELVSPVGGVVKPNGLELPEEVQGITVADAIGDGRLTYRQCLVTIVGYVMI